MKAEKYFLIVFVITGILCSTALSERELTPRQDDFLLIGRINPNLAGIDNLHVTIIHPEGEPNGLAWDKLKARINSKLNRAGIKVFSPEAGVMYKLPIWPELIIRVDILKLEQSRQCVFHIQTLLAKSIYLQLKPALSQKADVWKTEPVMQAVSVENMPAKTAEVVLKQVEVFIHAYLAANSLNKRASDANDISATAKEQLKPSAKSTPVEYRYVASKNSKVFHKSTCASAKRVNSASSA